MHLSAQPLTEHDARRPGVSELNLNAWLDTLPGNAAILGNDGCIRAVNAAWQRFARENGHVGDTCRYGHVGDTCRVGASYFAACADGADDASLHGALAASELRRVLDRGPHACSFEYPCHSPTRQRWFRTVAAPMGLADGRGALVVHVDVTEQRERVEAMRTARTPSAVADDAAIATAGLVHDLKTPLNALLGFAAALQMETAGRLSTKQREYLQLIETAGQQVLEQVNDYLVSAGEADTRPEGRLADAAGVAAGCLRLMAPLAEARNVRLKPEIPPTLPRIAMDGTALRRILHNLLENALKYAGSGATATLRGAMDGSWLTLLVHDDGAGVDLFDLGRLSEPFVRGQDCREDGHGLGLALVSSLAEAAGAALVIRSAPGHGFAGLLRVPPDRLRPAHPDVLDRCAACTADSDVRGCPELPEEVTRTAHRPRRLRAVAGL